jgi:hypothetical protein
MDTDTSHLQFADTDASLLQSADNDAIGRLYDEIKALRRSFPQGENIGQIKQTYDQIVKPMAGIRDLTEHVMRSNIEQLKRLSWKNVKAVSRALGSTVIEWRFGIAPLIRDLADVSVALQNRDFIADLVPFNVKGRRFAKVDSGSEQMTANGLNTTGCKFRRAWHNDKAARVRYKGALRVQSNVPIGLADTLGLTWGEVFSTAWNLVPYSFLIDYISNVGSMLDVFSFPWSNVAWCVKTTRQSAIYDGTFASFDGLDANGIAYPYGARVESMSPGMLSYTSTTFNRILQTDLPVQRLEFKLPNVRSLQSTASLLAAKLPILERVAKVRQSSLGRELGNQFNLVTRQTGRKVPYPKFSF